MYNAYTQQQANGTQLNMHNQETNKQTNKQTHTTNKQAIKRASKRTNITHASEQTQNIKQANKTSNPASERVINQTCKPCLD